MVLWDHASSGTSSQMRLRLATFLEASHQVHIWKKVVNKCICGKRLLTSVYLVGSPDAASEPVGAGHPHPPAHPACDRLQQADQAQVHRARYFLKISHLQRPAPSLRSTRPRSERGRRPWQGCLSLRCFKLDNHLICLNLHLINTYQS